MLVLFSISPLGLKPINLHIFLGNLDSPYIVLFIAGLNQILSKALWKRYHMQRVTHSEKIPMT